MLFTKQQNTCRDANIVICACQKAKHVPGLLMLQFLRFANRQAIALFSVKCFTISLHYRVQEENATCLFTWQARCLSCPRTGHCFGISNKGLLLSTLATLSVRSWLLSASLGVHAKHDLGQAKHKPIVSLSQPVISLAKPRSPKLSYVPRFNHISTYHVQKKTYYLLFYQILTTVQQCSVQYAAAAAAASSYSHFNRHKFSQCMQKVWSCL